MEEDNSNWFSRYFIPLFNITKYSIENLNENYVRLIVQKEESIELIIQTAFILENSEKFYILDFDAFCKNTGGDQIYNKIELLHDVILKEFHLLITEECRNWMRGS